MDSSSRGSFGDGVGEENRHLTTIWKCPGRFLGLQFLESLKTECVVLALKESLWVAGSGG